MDGNDGLTAVNNPSIVTGVEKPELLATSFNGSDQFINATTDVGLVNIGTSAFSLGGFLKTSSNGVMTAFSKGSSEDGTGFSFGLDISERGAFRINAFSFQTPGAINTGVFVHLMFTSSGSAGTLKVYLNGIQVDSDPLPSYNLNAAGNMSIAVFSDLFTPSFNGSIDGIRFYDRALNAATVLALSNFKTPE